MLCILVRSVFIHDRFFFPLLNCENSVTHFSFLAAQGNHVDVLRLLLRAGAERDASTDRGQWTPLHLACRYTSVECVLELLRWGADLGPTARPTAGDDTACRLRRRKDSSVFDFGAVSDERAEEEEGEEENGYGKTPAEVIGLKNLAAAATDPAGYGGRGPSYSDPSLDEEEEQMVVLGDDDGEKSLAERTQAPIHLFCTFVQHGTETCRN